MGCERNGATETDLVVCSNDGGSIACAALPVLRDTYFEFDEDMCDGQADDGYEVRVSLGGGAATVSRVSRSGDVPIPPGYVGRTPLTTVLSRFALEPR